MRMCAADILAAVLHLAAGERETRTGDCERHPADRENDAVGSCRY